MITATARRRRRPAFTMLELLLAIAMMAIVSLSLFASLRVAFRAQAGAEAAVEPSRTAELAMEAVKNDLEAALPPGDPEKNLASEFLAEDSRDNRGREADYIRFYGAVTGPGQAVSDGDIKRVEFEVLPQAGTNDHVLVRRVTGNLLSPDELVGEEEVICRGVGGFNLRYFDGTAWLDSWDATLVGNAVPTAIEVTLELDRPDGLGQPRTVRFSRVVQIICSAVPTAEEPAAGGTGTGTGGTGTGTGGTGTGTGGAGAGGAP